MAPPVNVAAVITEPLREWYEFSGRIKALDVAEIRPQVSGVIKEIQLSEGERVEAGDILMIIDPRPFEASVIGSQGDLNSAKAQLALAQSDMKRSEKLIKNRAIPQFQFDESRNALTVAEARVKTAEAALEIAQLNFDYAHIKAPFSGRVGRAEITAGNLVETGPNAPILTTIVADNEVYADFDIDEVTFLKYIHAQILNDPEKIKNIPVHLSLTGENGFPHKGYLKSFDNRIDLDSGTIRARAIIDNSRGKLLSGMFARVRLGSPDIKPRLLITDRAVGTDQDKKFVMIVDEKNTAQRREITLGPVIDEGLRIVRSGIKEGEKVIVNGLQRVQSPGQPVQPEEISMRGAAQGITTQTQPPETNPDDAQSKTRNDGTTPES